MTTDKTRTCLKCGSIKPIEEFYTTKARGIKTTSNTCRKCKSESAREWYKNNRDSVREGKKWVSDDDKETDLIPMESIGFVRWAVITTGRRMALGEKSPYNGQSSARWRTTRSD